MAFYEVNKTYNSTENWAMFTIGGGADYSFIQVQRWGIWLIQNDISVACEKHGWGNLLMLVAALYAESLGATCWKGDFSPDPGCRTAIEDWYYARGLGVEDGLLRGSVREVAHKCERKRRDWGVEYRVVRL